MGDVVGQFTATYLLPEDPWNEYGLYVERLNYPASDAGAYQQSVTSGVLALQAELEWMASRCATLPAVVLAGHSQGAQVILTALAPGSEIKFGGGFYPTLSAKARSMIRAVVVWGDPTWKAGTGWNSSDSMATGQGIFARGQASLDYLASEYKSWGWPQGSTSPNPQWVPKIRSYCFAKDWACQAGSPIDNAIHSSCKYYMSGPRSFVQYMMTDFS
ncbi:Cutinase [Microbacterium oxydans]|uniref:Cutinase n=1 Tax=Microbacterium oxydans TaxID=82380 RepID=A0A0F0KYZ8_9MICO|nr:cutinase family protein [Microbacterium oxydans]KJL24511.1 Cutinase [Microbacterium oxydans]